VAITLILADTAESIPLGESSIAMQDCADNFNFSKAHSYISGDGFLFFVLSP